MVGDEEQVAVGGAGDVGAGVGLSVAVAAVGFGAVGAATFGAQIVDAGLAGRATLIGWYQATVWSKSMVRLMPVP